jgi:hypothetical protein
MLCAMSAPPAPAPPSRGTSRKRLILARILTVVGLLLLVVSVLANYVDRAALDESRFRTTARQLVSDRTITDQLALSLVDQLYSNTDVAATLEEKLPPNLQQLAVPLAGLARNAADSAAKELLTRPKVQELFVEAASRAQRLFVAVLDGDTTRLQATNGDVVLNLRPILLRLAERFNIDESTISPTAGQILIMHSDQLKTGQRATRALRFTANWIWALVLIAWAGAIWLAGGRRRLEVRAIAIGFLVAGFLILIIRGLAERWFVNDLIKSDSVRPAGQHTFEIITNLLKGAGWTAVIVGFVAMVGVWLTGPGRRAGQAREFLAPYMSGAGAYAVTIVGYLLLLWWRPTPQFGYWVNVIIFFVLLMIGTEVLRRQLAREHPQPAPAT